MTAKGGKNFLIALSQLLGQFFRGEYKVEEGTLIKMQIQFPTIKTAQFVTSNSRVLLPHSLNKTRFDILNIAQIERERDCVCVFIAYMYVI